MILKPLISEYCQKNFVLKKMFTNSKIALSEKVIM